MAEFDAAAFGATLGRAFSENGIGGMLSFDRVKTLTAMTERSPDPTFATQLSL